MTVSQISVFAESKPGHLARVLRMFENAQVNVRGYAVSDTGEFGITRFIADRPDAACAALERSGFAFVTSEVICCRLADVPGELARVMEALAAADDNVLYSYSMISTYIIVATTDVEKTQRVLAAADVEMIDQADIERIVAQRFGEADAHAE